MNKYYKYPRTFHLPWSLGATSDDKVLKSVDHFLGKEVVVTEKMDGENCTLCRNKAYARSIDGNTFYSQHFVRGFWGKIKHDIPENFHICGEDLYARHSLYYTDLAHYFYGFSVWQEDVCLPWDDTLMWFDMLDIVPVPFLYRGQFDVNLLQHIAYSLDLNKHEGYVVRLASSFQYTDFADSVAKFVRPGHVQTDKHWKHQAIIPNKLRTV